MTDSASLIVSGALIGIIFMIAMILLANSNANNDCAKEHYVYECYMVWVPEKPEDVK